MFKKNPKYNYVPMTDEEIEASRKKIEMGSQEGKVKVVKMPQVLYGPPQREEAKVEVVEMPQVLYGPPPREEAKVEVVEMPQLLYGPPPKPEVHVVEVQQDLYGPPPRELDEMLNDGNAQEKGAARKR